MAIKALEKEFELDPEEYGFPMTEIRFVLVDTETGEIVDDAQGYGYSEDLFQILYGKRNRSDSQGSQSFLHPLVEKRGLGQMRRMRNRFSFAERFFRCKQRSFQVLYVERKQCSFRLCDVRL